jgi:hypothetical protein
MGQVRKPGDPLEDALDKAAEAGRRDPDDADIAADDAGGTRLAEAIEAEDESEAHPS